MHPSMARPVIKGSIGLTLDLLKALKAKGANEYGKYEVDIAMWYDEEKKSEKSPDLKGPVTVKGVTESPKAYGTAWLNLEDSPSPAPVAAASSSEDELF